MCTSHITFNPNLGGESGGYFHSTIRVPHGAVNLHTTSLTIHVPHGVVVAKPEVPEDWTATIERRSLSEIEQYTSHGRLVTDAPSKITLRANEHEDGVHNDHLLNIDIQLKLGCIFQDKTTNSLWNNQYTLWWKIDQHCEDVHGNHLLLSWNGTQQDSADGTSPSWSALPDGVQPAPYIYVDPGVRCSINHVGNELPGGLLWFGTHQTNDMQQNVKVPEPSNETPSNETLQYITLVVSIVGLVLGAVAFLFWLIIACIRLNARKKFAEKLIGIEAISSTNSIQM